MSEAVVDDIVTMLPSLLQSLEALAFIARYLNPLEFDQIMEAAGAPDQTLRAVRPRLAQWPEGFADVRIALESAGDSVLAAFDELRAIRQGHGEFVAVLRALRHLPRAQEALYPLAAKFPPVSNFFVDPALRDDAGLLAKLAEPPRPGSGIIHEYNERGGRGGFSLYVPEYYTPDRNWALVTALHGGSGNGRRFLWNWLRDARSFGAILITPTAIGSTWALMDEDADTPNLMRILDQVRSRWNIDSKRLLLTGMSDGGTFCYVTGLESSSPFTHLAPVASTFHPLMAEMADAQRVRNLPIYLVHGRLDWMFPVEIARRTREALTTAGANVIYREIEDLSHSYPREINPALVSWINSGAT